jgi:hypothetical protein
LRRLVLVLLVALAGAATDLHGQGASVERWLDSARISLLAGNSGLEFDRLFIALRLSPRQEKFGWTAELGSVVIRVQEECAGRCVTTLDRGISASGGIQWSPRQRGLLKPYLLGGLGPAFGRFAGSIVDREGDPIQEWWISGTYFTALGTNLSLSGRLETQFEVGYRGVASASAGLQALAGLRLRLGP